MSAVIGFSALRQAQLALGLLLILGRVAVAGDSTTRPATSPGIEVRVTSVKMDYVSLQTPGEPQEEAKGSSIFGTGSDGPKSDNKQVIVHVTIVNTGKEDLVYHTFSGTDKSCPGFAYLRGDDHRTYSVVQFGDLEPAGSVRSAHVAAGKSVKDVIVFEKPPENAGPLHLVLPAQNIGGAGPVELVVAWSNL